MKNNDKITIIFYVFLAIALGAGFLYINSTFDTTTLPNILPEPTTKLEIIKEVQIDREKIFLIMTDLENYSKVLPQNIKSVEIIEDFDSEILAEYEVVEAGITSELLVQHSMSPYYEHTMEVMSGDAQGTKVTQNFTDTNSVTTIHTIVELDLKGILSPFGFLPKVNLEHAANTILTSFIDYAKISENQTKKIIDDLYREILQRPADNEALEHWGSLLDSGTMTVNEVRDEILNSDERKSILLLQEMKTVEELDEETKKIIDDLYREILQRPADNEALEHWGSLLENKKITNKELRKIILKSEEAYAYHRLDVKSKELVYDAFNEVYETSGPHYGGYGEDSRLYFDPRIDMTEFRQMFDKNRYLLYTEEITVHDLRFELEQLKENGIDFFIDDLESNTILKNEGEGWVDASIQEQFLDWQKRFVDKTDVFCYYCKWGTPTE